MNNLIIEIGQTNADLNYQLHSPLFFETKYSNKTELYRSLIKEYGKCTGKVYIAKDGKNRKPSHVLDCQVGWIFSKREFYSDAELLGKKAIKSMNAAEKKANTFMCSTWISVHTEMPKVETTKFYAKF